MGYRRYFAAVTETLKEYGQRKLGGELGITAVLHTWGQQLPRHIHLHTLVTGGALGWTAACQRRWQASKPNYLVDIVAVAATFRDKFCAGLLALYTAGQLVLRGAAAALDVPALVAEMQAKSCSRRTGSTKNTRTRTGWRRGSTRAVGCARLNPIRCF